jgi:hypothetical protein
MTFIESLNICAFVRDFDVRSDQKDILVYVDFPLEMALIQIKITGLFFCYHRQLHHPPQQLRNSGNNKHNRLDSE